MGHPLFSLLRPAYESTPELAVAASQARADLESSNALSRQTQFDDQVAQELASLKLTDSGLGAFENLLFRPSPNTNSAINPAGLPNPDEKGSTVSHALPEKREKEEEIEEDEEEPPKRARPRTIMIAVGVGLVATLCMVIFLISDRMNSFEGADRISELLESADN